MSILSPVRETCSHLLDTFTCPREVKTNRNTGLIRLIACLCMVIDHAGKMLFPQYHVMRLIGRMAFPLFAYGIAVGAVYTRDPIRYLTRVVLLALISQPLYAVGLAHENSAMYAVPLRTHPLLGAWTFYLHSWQKPSILLTLSLGLLILICVRKRRWVLALGVYMLCERFAPELDYGIGGIRLMLLFYALCEHPLLALAILPAYTIAWSAGTGYIVLGHEFSIRIYALPAVILTCLPLRGQLKLPRWFVYGFYPAHLLVLFLLTHA
ncbi:MAG: TraX family protein [Candidatus Ventricola sp.]